MIEKAMLGALELEDEWELQRIGWQRDARNKGMAIQPSPLHTALIETHLELAKITQEAKDIVVVCKRAEKALEQMQREWSTTKKTNEELTSGLQDVETKLKKAEHRIQGYESQRSHVLDASLEAKLAVQVANIKQATKRAKEAEAEQETITKCLQAIQEALEAITQARQEEQEKKEELELYIQVQEETYAKFVAKVEMSREELDRKYRDLEEKYKKTRHILIVAEARLWFDHDTIENL